MLIISFEIPKNSKHVTKVSLADMYWIFYLSLLFFFFWTGNRHNVFEVLGYIEHVYRTNDWKCKKYQKKVCLDIALNWK